MPFLRQNVLAINKFFSTKLKKIPGTSVSNIPLVPLHYQVDPPNLRNMASPVYERKISAAIADSTESFYLSPLFPEPLAEELLSAPSV